VLVGAVLVSAVVATVVGSRIWSQADAGVGSIFAWTALVFAAAGPLASRLLLVRAAPPAGATIDGLARRHAAVDAAVSGATGIVATFAWMVSGDVVAAAAIVTAVVALLLVFPSARRWDELRTAATRSGAPSRATFADARATQFPIPAKIFGAGYVALLVLGVAAVALLGIHFWNVAAGRPASPVVTRLLVTTLALGMAWIGTSRLLTLAASRRRRWRTATGVLQLLLAGYLLFLAASME
jgi:hypothetical protein